MSTALAFRQSHTRRFGTKNPELMNDPFWLAQIRSGLSGHFAMNAAGIALEEDDFDGPPVWSFARFGQARVQLPDGRILAIAGEHEGSYDPEFCIYNDVTIFHPDGRIELFGYSREIFPPIDFHTATLVGDDIFLVGNLGYSEDRRHGHTPIFRLHVPTLAITPVETSGTPPPGLHDHYARYLPITHTLEFRGGHTLLPDGSRPLNRDRWALDLFDFRWRCLGPNTPLLPTVAYPDPWSPLTQEDSISRSSSLSHELPPGHPLYVLPAQGLAEMTRWPSLSLFHLLDGTDRIAVVDLSFFGRQPLPHPTFELFTTLDDFLDTATADPSHFTAAPWDRKE